MYGALCNNEANDYFSELLFGEAESRAEQSQTEADS